MSPIGLTARSAGRLPALAGVFAFLVAVAGSGVGVHAAQTAQAAQQLGTNLAQRVLAIRIGSTSD